MRCSSREVQVCAALVERLVQVCATLVERFRCVLL